MYMYRRTQNYTCTTNCVLEHFTGAKRDWRQVLDMTWERMNPKYYFKKRVLPHLEGVTMYERVRLQREAQIDYFPWFIFIITLVRLFET